MSEDTPNRVFVDLERKEILIQGKMKVSNADRTDLFYRRCECQTAAFHAGMDVEVLAVRRW